MPLFYGTTFPDLLFFVEGGDRKGEGRKEREKSRWPKEGAPGQAPGTEVPGIVGHRGGDSFKVKAKMCPVEGREIEGRPALGFSGKTAKPLTGRGGGPFLTRRRLPKQRLGTHACC